MSTRQLPQFDPGTGGIDPKTMPERCYTMLKSLSEFDKLEVAGVVRGLLAKTDRDNCFIGNYYRGKAHIETLLSLKSAKDLQAIAQGRQYIRRSRLNPNPHDQDGKHNDQRHQESEIDV